MQKTIIANVSDTALEPGKAAEARETHKLKKYEELKSNYIVTPVGKTIGDLTG